MGIVIVRKPATPSEIAEMCAEYGTFIKLADGTYDDLMAHVYGGWDNLPDDEIRPWTAEDEALIEAWLAEGEV